MLCGLLIPTYGFGVISFNTFARVIALPEVELRFDNSLLSRGTIPTYGLGIILFDAFAFVIGISEIELRIGMSQLCRCLEPLNRPYRASALSLHSAALRK